MQHIDEKQLVGALLSASPPHPSTVPSVRVLTPKSSSKSLKDALVRKKSESTLIIPTISVTPAEGDEPEPKGRRDSFLAAQEAIAAARGVLSGNVTALDSEGADEPLNGSPSGLGKGRRGRRGRRIKPKPLVNFDEEKLAAHGSHSHEVDLDHPSIGFTHVRPRRSYRTTIIIGAVALVAIAIIVAIIVGVKMSH